VGVGVRGKRGEGVGVVGNGLLLLLLLLMMMMVVGGWCCCLCLVHTLCSSRPSCRARVCGRPGSSAVGLGCCVAGAAVGLVCCAHKQKKQCPVQLLRTARELLRLQSAARCSASTAAGFAGDQQLNASALSEEGKAVGARRNTCKKKAARTLLASALKRYSTAYAENVAAAIHHMRSGTGCRNPV